MCALLLDHQTTLVRSVAETDARVILKLLESSWRIHIRMAWSSLRYNLKTMPGLIAEDHVGVRGFMLIEPQMRDVAIIVAAGLRDTWSERPFLDALLPPIERLAQAQGVASLVYIGHEPWLIDGLRQRGFEPQEWILTFERLNNNLPPFPPAPARLRSAHRNDLSVLLDVDTLAFDRLWRKSFAYFNEALARADSFMVAEVEGRVVGYEWCEVHQQHAHLTRLAVHPRYQGLGIGAQLLGRAISDVLDQGATLMTLNTQETNRRSQDLYIRFGFAHTQQRVPVLWKSLE